MKIITKVNKILNRLSKGTPPEFLEEEEVDILKEYYGNNWFTALELHINSIDDIYKRRRYGIRTN